MTDRIRTYKIELKVSKGILDVLKPSVQNGITFDDSEVVCETAVSRVYTGSGEWIEKRYSAGCNEDFYRGWSTENDYYVRVEREFDQYISIETDKRFFISYTSDNVSLISNEDGELAFLTNVKHCGVNTKIIWNDFYKGATMGSVIIINGNDISLSVKLASRHIADKVRTGKISLAECIPVKWHKYIDIISGEQWVYY